MFASSFHIGTVHIARLRGGSRWPRLYRFWFLLAFSSTKTRSSTVESTLRSEGCLGSIWNRARSIGWRIAAGDRWSRDKHVRDVSRHARFDQLFQPEWDRHAAHKDKPTTPLVYSLSLAFYRAFRGTAVVSFPPGRDFPRERNGITIRARHSCETALLASCSRPAHLRPDESSAGGMHCALIPSIARYTCLLL